MYRPLHAHPCMGCSQSQRIVFQPQVISFKRVVQPITLTLRFKTVKMKLIVINSNSAGNAYALDSGTDILLLEAGVKMSEVKRCINYRLSDVVGVCISHSHG